MPLQTIVDPLEQTMARAKSNSGSNDFYQDFDEFDERLVENQYGVKIKNLGRTPKKTKKIKFDGDNIEW
jgi:hypothetical protein